MRGCLGKALRPSCTPEVLAEDHQGFGLLCAAWQARMHDGDPMGRRHAGLLRGSTAALCGHTLQSADA